MSNLNISQRAQNVVPSPIRKYHPLMVKAQEERGLEIIKLNVGDPDVPVPSLFLETIKQYNKPNIGYAPSSGIKEYVESWVEYYKKNGIEVESSNIVPTQGAAEAILFSMLAVTDPEDEIIVFEPLYVAYRGFAEMAGITLKPVTLKVDDNFALPDISEIEKLITDKTKAIVIITPDNPSGKAWNKDEVKSVIDLAIKHDLFLISDETYREIVFEGEPVSLLQFPEARDIAIVLDSLSKRFSLTGARLGCLVSYNKDIMRSVLKFAMTRLSVGTLEQIGAIPLLQNPTEFISKTVEIYRKRRDVVFEGLKQIPGIVCHMPKGAFYIVAKLPVEDTDDFIKYLLTDFEHEGKTVMFTPISDFYITPNSGKGEIRIAFVLEIPKLKQALEMLKLALERYKK